MSKLQTAAARRTRATRCFPIVLALLGLGGCAQNDANLQMDNPSLSAYVQLIMPAQIRIEPNWTKLVSLAGDGDPDGLEIVLVAYDSFGDNTKLVGTLHFELFTRRMASSDRLEKRVAFWPLELNTRDSLTRHWDPLSRFYTFKVGLEESPLPPGRYILTARLMPPTGERLVDEYEFTLEPGPVPPAARGR